MPRKLGGIMGCAVVYYARAAHAFSAGIKCRNCNREKVKTSWVHYVINPIVMWPKQLNLA